MRVELLRFTLATDGDIHLAVAEPGKPDATMIAEIPDPARMTGAPKKYREEVGVTRRAFIRAFGAPMLNAWHDVNREVAITGPIFFDLISSQIGGSAAGAPTAVEIHPVLRLEIARQGKTAR